MSVVANSPASWDERAAAPSSWEAGLQSERGQTLRFRAVLSHLQLHDGDTVLDFGSGAGRLAAWMPYGVEYYAHDWAPALLDRAVREQPNAVRVDEIPDMLFDHVVAVGPFNLSDGWSRPRTWETLAELFMERTRKTLVVSLLRWRRGLAAGVLGYDNAELLRFATDMGVTRFAIDATYLDNDILLALHR